MEIQVKRVFEPAADTDGYRVLVDRLWPRGVSKEKAKIDLWPKDIAPSTELRHWYKHDPEKWESFKKRYAAELEQQQEVLNLIRERVALGPVTLVYSSREERFNNAVALREYLKATA